MTAGIGPPGGTIYAFDQAYRVIATPTSLPNRGPFDTIYVFPNCPTCASVSEAAPGHPGYNGGRWRVVPYAIARIRTPPGPRNGALQSLQRGGDGNAPHIRRIRCRRG